MNGGITIGVYQIARITNPDVDLKPYLEGQLRQQSSRSRRARTPLQTLFGALLLLAVFSMRMGFFPFFFMGGRRGGGFSGGSGGFGGFSGGGGGFSGGGASGGW